MSNQWQCPNCGKRVGNPETQSKQALWAGLLALFTGIVWIGVVGTKPASQVSELACFCPTMLFFFGIMGILFWGLMKNQIQTGKFKKITCPVCKSTWDPAEARINVNEIQNIRGVSVNYRNQGEKKFAEEAAKKPLKKYGNDGYLLPEYWRCIVCKGHRIDQRATYSVHVKVFELAIMESRYFQDLNKDERALVQKYTRHVLDPYGGTKAQPSGTEQFEDTSGLARDRTGGGFDAVFLCETHLNEMNKAITALGKEGSKRSKKKK